MYVLRNARGEGIGMYECRQTNLCLFYPHADLVEASLSVAHADVVLYRARENVGSLRYVGYNGPTQNVRVIRGPRGDSPE
jgi:hypothetical protein